MSRPRFLADEDLRYQALNVRRERPGDEDAIDVVNCSAFQSMNEANIVRLMRQYSSSFDPKYSLTAWENDQIVGHALFTPARLRLMGKTVEAIALGPIGVVPHRQRSGIGGHLIRVGHEMARADGFMMCFLLGHRS